MTALPDGLHPLHPGKLAVVVTFFEMRRPPSATPMALPPGVSVAFVQDPATGWYRALYDRVGAAWLWFGRRALDDAALAATLRRPSHRMLAMTRDGAEIGFAELDGEGPTEVEIVYFGLASEATGGGLGRGLMQAALALAWAPGVRRVWLRTCTADDPRAIAFYRRMGFTPYAQAVEVFDDPRLTGLLPRDAAPRLPLLPPLSQV